jgi:hypothetical protein
MRMLSFTWDLIDEPLFQFGSIKIQCTVSAPRIDFLFNSSLILIILCLVLKYE